MSPRKVLNARTYTITRGTILIVAYSQQAISVIPLRFSEVMEHVVRPSVFLLGKMLNRGESTGSFRPLSTLSFYDLVMVQGAVCQLAKLVVCRICSVQYFLN